MKPALLPLIVVLLALLLATCEKHERNNPWDEKASLAPDAWAPQNFLIEDVTITEKRLSWTYDDKNIEGFKLDRKKGDDPWQTAYQTFAKETRSFTDQEIVPETGINYQYRLYTFAGTNKSAEKAATVSAAIPPPTNLQLEKLSDISYKLTWQDNSTGEEGFKIDRKAIDNVWVIGYGTVAANETSFVDINVFIGKSSFIVEYRVYAIYNEFESAKASESTNAALTPPTDLTIIKNSITTVTLNWQDNSTSEEGFKVERKYETGDWVEVATTTGTSWQDNDFELNTIVYYRVYAYLGNYVSSNSDNSYDATIPPPTDLHITKNTITSVTLNWQDNSAGEHGFKIERKYAAGDWVEVATTSGASWQDNDFELNTIIYYRVNAYYKQYKSAWTENSFNATIPSPENFTITANSATSLTLNWSYSLTGHQGFKIDRKIDNGIWAMLLDNLNPDQNSFSDNGLDLPLHEYSYRIYVHYEGLESNYAEEISSHYILSIGDIYKGGIVFYLDGSGGGLVCTESDQSPNAEWGCSGTTIGGTSTSIGAGASNTTLIVTGCSQTGIAARFCSNLVLNGYSDWFLPSKDELNLMYQNLKLNSIGGFENYNYWSSSEYSSNYSWLHYFSNGYQGSYYKGNSGRVRAVRSF